MSIGRYKGKTYEWIKANDAGYCHWASLTMEEGPCDPALQRFVLWVKYGDMVRLPQPKAQSTPRGQTAEPKAAPPQAPDSSSSSAVKSESRHLSPARKRNPRPPEEEVMEGEMSSEARARIQELQREIQLIQIQHRQAEAGTKGAKGSQDHAQ